MDEEPEAECLTASGIGLMLQSARLKNGKHLREVAETLRIRLLYLTAIEEGRFEDLPGSTYAVGFIRSYAEYLGLDSEEVIRLYKSETETAHNGKRLSFPVPITGNEIPSGAILFIAALAAALAYGGWYISSSKNIFEESVSSLPERLANNEKPAPDPTLKSETPAAPAVKPDSTTEDFLSGLEKQIGESKKTPAAAKTGGQSDAAVKKAPIPSHAAASPTVLSPEARPSPEGSKEEVKKDEAKKEAPPPSVTALEALPPPKEILALKSAAVETPTGATGPKAPPAVIPESAVPAPEGTVAGRVFGDTNEKSRILVRAKKNSWIQIRDDVSKKLLLTRLLRRGDSYLVPDQAGLTLVTGDVNALEILIDGKLAPPIHDSETIRRSIHLDPDKLKAGAALAN